MKPYQLNRPAGLEKYVLERANYAYLIFNKTHVFCTNCGMKTEKLQVYVHNHEYECEFCERPAIAKSFGRGRKNITEKGRILWFEHKDGVDYAQLDKYDIDYDASYWTTVTFQPEAQYKFGKNTEMHKWKPQWGDWEHWEQMKTIKIPDMRTGYYGQRSNYCYKTILHKETVSNLKSKAFQYLDKDQISIYAPGFLVPYLALYAKYQSIELMEKAGFKRIVESLVRGERSKYIHLRGKSLEKIFRTTKGEYNQLKDMALGDFEWYMHHKKYGVRIEHRPILGYRGEEALLILGERRVKVLDYLLKQRNKSKVLIYIRDYMDYMEWIEKIGAQIDKRTLYPKDFWKAHDAAEEEYKEIQEKVDEGKFKETELKITGMKEPYIRKGLMIRPAESAKELREESKALEHCVRTYADKVIKGKTSILFIRRLEDPNKPYYTLELDDKRHIVQCRGYKNCGYPEEVDVFISEWYKSTYKRKRA